MSFLAVSKADMKKQGLSALDFIIVSADAYVDHPSFGVALVGRYLESLGYSVGVIARPDPAMVESFRLLGRPKLAFLVSGGAMDSIVCKYTANLRLRSKDDYAPGGDPALCLGQDGKIKTFFVNGKKANARPDRAVIAYTGRCKEAYKGVPVILGGIEASLRRMSHYDYLSDSIRKPIIMDSKAELVIYGMAEHALKEAAKRLSQLYKEEGSKALGEGRPFDAAVLRSIPGTVWKTSIEAELPEHALRLPSYEAVSGTDSASLRLFATSFAAQYRNTDPATAKPLAEQAGSQFAVQEPPAKPLSMQEMDSLYALHFERRPHPVYDAFGGVPAIKEVVFSLTSSRGCFGACAFCAIVFHEGRIISSRSVNSLVNEARLLTALPGFKGYIHDLGGPTANFRLPACKKQAGGSSCVNRRCLAPEPCPELVADHRDYLEALRAVRSLPGVKKLFVRSGLRFDYAMEDKDKTFIKELAARHVSGQLRVAPEHVSDSVLKLMGKPKHQVYENFAQLWSKTNKELGLKQYLVPYFISAHPGAGLKEAIELAEYLRDSAFVPDQVQDFYPGPGTLATAMYRSGLDPLTMEEVYVAKTAKERAYQRALLQYTKPENRSLVKEALKKAGRSDLIGRGPKCLVN